MLRSKILAFLFAVLLATDLFASHYMGGEITWQCLGNGRFRFIMKLYRECAGITYGNPETITVTNCPSIASIQMNLFPGGDPRDIDDGSLDGKTDLSPACWQSPPPIACNPSPSLSNTGAVEEWYYTSDNAYPTGVLISGVPPAAGWIFSNTSCCRNPCTNIPTSTSDSWFLRAIMYPYNGQNTFPCYDNSPAFAEVPSTVICTGYPFTYNHNASDKELDSLVYDWAPALNGSLTVPEVYAAGFSFNSPLPGPSLNPLNVAATINSHTGEISYTSYTAGAFVTVTKVTAYRCGKKIAEIFREMQIVLLNCPGAINHQPTVTPPFYNPITGIYDLYIDTVMAGQTVDFDINAIDTDMLPNGNPNTVTLETSSQDYGAGYTDPNNGCVDPPCATLNPPPPLSAMVAVATHFHWQTTCDDINFNIGCANLTNVHNFYFKIYDNGCPANAINGVTVSVVVVAPPVLKAPQIHCAEVMPNGDVILTWDIPPDTSGTFNSYHLYSSTSPTGPFAEVDSIFSYNQTSYTHVGAGANSDTIYYYMRSRSGCFGKFYSPHTSDTVASIHLNVTAIGGGQIANLTWNPFHAPPLPSSMGWYRIYREYPVGTWLLLDSVQTLNYLDTVTVCNAMVTYRIEIGDTIGCKSVSSVDSAQLMDGFPPDTPILDSVSVIGGITVLGWNPAHASDTRKYIIYKLMGGPWQIRDSVPGINNTYYADLTSNPQAGSESYRIAAKDSCKHLSAMGLEHRTIFLDTLGIDVCADKILLSWNSYINWSPSVKGYLVYMSENGQPYTQLANVTAPTTTYDHAGLNENSNYCYYIKAYNGQGVSSTSNVQCITARKPHEPQYIYMRYATVVNNELARIGFFVDTTAYISSYKVLRSEDGINFNTLTTLPANNVYSTVEYDDYSALVNEKSYYYKVIVVDSCHLDADTSNMGRTIYLYGNGNTYLLNHLEWTPYEDRIPLVYNIFRQIENYDAMHRIPSPPGNPILYNDDVSMWTETSGRFDYVIQASLYDIFDQKFPFADTVYSNKILLIQSPRVYVANAFTPGGYNPIYKPIGSYIESNEYYFAIYSRWGEKIFETTDVNEGWNGYYKGNLCKMGVYTYYVRCKLSNGKDFQKRGSVNLVR